MSTSRSSKTFSDVIEYLDEKKKGASKPRLEKLGNHHYEVNGDHEVLFQVDSRNFSSTDLSELLTNIRIRLILDNDSKIDEQSKTDGRTALILAVIQNQVDLVKILLDHGANPSIPDNEGKDAIWHAASKGYGDILKEFVDMIEEGVVTGKKIAGADASLNLAKHEASKGPAGKKPSEPFRPQRVKLDANLFSRKFSEKDNIYKLMGRHLSPTLPDIRFKTSGSDDSPPPSKRALQELVGQLCESQQARSRNGNPSASTSGNARTRSTNSSGPTSNLSHPDNSANLLTIAHSRVGDTLSPEERERGVMEAEAAAGAIYAEKIKEIKAGYESFHMSNFKRFLNEFKQSTWKQLENAPRNLSRPASLNAEVKGSSEDIPESPLSLSYSDKAAIKAAISFLTDYSAPERAPIPSPLQSGFFRIRRILTFHWNRDHLNRAKRLVNNLRTENLETPEDVQRIYDAINSEFTAIKLLKHDKHNNNSIFNSTYTQRLYMALEGLKITSAYKLKNGGMTRQAYLTEFDMRNSTLRMEEEAAAGAIYAEKIKEIKAGYESFHMSHFKRFLNEFKQSTWKQLEHAPRNPSHQASLNAEAKGNLEDIPESPLSLSYSDKAAVKAAISFFTDYYAPERAPIPSSLQSGFFRIRRILTFHWNRDHLNRAKDLVNNLRADHLETPANVQRIYDAINSEFTEIKLLKHDKHNDNSILNSPYAQRLYMALEGLKKTSAYKLKNNEMTDIEYLTEFNKRNSKLRNEMKTETPINSMKLSRRS